MRWIVAVAALLLPGAAGLTAAEPLTQDLPVETLHLGDIAGPRNSFEILASTPELVEYYESRSLGAPPDLDFAGRIVIAAVSSQPSGDCAFAISAADRTPTSPALTRVQVRMGLSTPALCGSDYVQAHIASTPRTQGTVVVLDERTLAPLAWRQIE